MFALYVSGFAYATNEPLARGDAKPVPHIALLLPLKSAIFGAAADALRQGFVAASELEMLLPGTLPVRIYASFDESRDIAALYRQAINAGARAVVGPLTKNGVSALAATHDTPVTTLALNAVEGYSADHLYFFGMAVEDEAKLAAQLARRQGLRRAIVISTHTQLALRLQAAFEEEWHSLGGLVLQEIEYKNDHAIFADIALMPDTAVFLAADAENARLIRPYLPNNTPIFATSQIFLGNGDTLTNYDLNGIRFVDMPWMLAPDHPAVMVYPRPSASFSADHERLYALGIDAFRLIQLLLSGKIEPALPLDGVSGQIDLYDHTFVRIATPAIFSQGQARSRQAAPLSGERSPRP